MLGYIGTKKEKQRSNQTKNTTRGNKSEGPGERKMTKKISSQNQTIETKQNISKQRKNFYLQIVENARRHTNKR